MYQYQYGSAADLIKIANQHNLKISEVALLHEAEQDEVDTQAIVDKMKTAYLVMKTNIQSGVDSTQPSIGGLIGQSAAAMNTYMQGGKTFGGPIMCRAITYALAITEENARMKRIVACPTAGASGVVPGCLFAAGEERGLTDQDLIDGLFTASAIGVIIANNATISGAEGGCQAEVGAASAMAASALAELGGGSVEACIHAAAISLKNILGLVCDPVGGLVEVPCSKRNAIGVANAIAAADMALAGIRSMVPLDEVVHAMKEIGCAMTRELKETAKGGIASSKTARDFVSKMKKP